MNIAIIFAGGRGERLNADSIPKQFIDIDEKPLIIHTLMNFQNHKEIDKIYIAILPEYSKHMENLVKSYGIDKVKGIVNGGNSAQESIFNALISALKENPRDSVVLIHDGVRPILTDEVISRNIASVKEFGSAITCIPAHETVLVSKDGKTPDSVPFRREIYKGQAPQSFYLGEIVEAHEKIRKRSEKYKDMIDSCTIYHTLGRKTHLVEGNFGNIKVTTKEDVYILKGLLKMFKERENANKAAQND